LTFAIKYWFNIITVNVETIITFYGKYCYCFNIYHKKMVKQSQQIQLLFPTRKRIKTNNDDD